MTYASIIFQLCFIRIRSCGRDKSKTKSKTHTTLIDWNPEVLLTCEDIGLQDHDSSIFSYPSFFLGSSFEGRISFALAEQYIFSLAVHYVQIFVVSAFVFVAVMLGWFASFRFLLLPWACLASALNCALCSGGLSLLSDTVN